MPPTAKPVAVRDRFLRARVGRHDRLGRCRAAPSRERAAPPRALRRAPCRAAAARRSRPSRGRSPPRGSRPSSRAVSTAVARASATPCSPVAAFATPEFATTACGCATARCSRETTTGAARNRFVVNIAVPVGRHERAHEREVALAALADARSARRRDEALGGGDAHTSTPASRRPSVSSSPSARFAFCIACPAAPLPRLSSAQITIA